MRLLVIKPSSLGDIVHGLQVLAAWVAARAALEVTWVVRAEFAPLVELSSLVQRVIVFERRGGCASWRRLWVELRREPFDLVLDLQGLLRSGLMTAVARAPRKVGRPDAWEGARWFYDVVVARPEGAADGVPWERVRGAVVVFLESRRAEKNWGGFATLTGELLRRDPARRVVWWWRRGGDLARLEVATVVEAVESLVAR
jgi:hypothetical protein